MYLPDFLHDFFALFFPKTCVACGKSLVETEDILCTHCLFSLPKSNSHLNPKQNFVIQKLWGRFPVEWAISYLIYHKKTIVQDLLFHFKYKNRPDIGYKLGKMYGRTIINTKLYGELDAIIPVPLHPNKLKKRGYNQSEQWANGLGESLDIPVYAHLLIRQLQKSSQIHKTRFQRFKNAATNYKMTDIHLLKNKHILLVDDVLTTGATIEACAAALLLTEGLKISVATLAAAE